MQDDGNARARPDPGMWRGYAQIALIVIALAVAFYFARAPNFGASPGDPVSELVSGPPVVDVVVSEPTEQFLTV